MANFTDSDFYLKNKQMKKTLFFTMIIIVALVSCKTTKKAASSSFEPAVQTTNTSAKPKVFTVPQTKETTPVANEEKPIAVREEAITFTEPKEQNKNNFFIITGSFSSLENARNFRQTLITEGFKPIIVQSETGFYRVTVDSFAEETPARARLLQIRKDFQKYADTWLLKIK